MTNTSTAALDRTPGRSEPPADSRVCRQGALDLGRLLVPQLIEKHAQETPDRVAVACNGVTLTYGELDRVASRLARRLVAGVPGIGADSVVGLRIGRSERLLIAILAVWKAGAAFIPLDPTLPPRRVLEMMQPARACLLITEAAHAPGDRELADPVWVIEEALADLPAAEEKPGAGVSAHDLAYVLFTSGSTGAPKGAMVEHIGMWNNMANKALDLGLGPDARVAQTASMSFDVFVWQMFIALTQGGTTHVYGEQVVNDVAELLARLTRERVTILEVVPTYLLILVEFLEAHPRLADGLAITNLLTTGEAVEAALIRRFFALRPTTRVVNAYGPTEASDDITHHVMSAGDPLDNPVPVGRALANFDVYVVDEALGCVPRGAKGEIAVTGVGVGRGYIGMAEATARAFVDSPFPDRYEGRMYKTGDIGYMRPDGLLVYCGRKDKQVKIRGMRIELEEVESKLAGLPQVRQAAVVEKRLDAGYSVLHAFVVLSPGQGEDAMMASLREVLPPYMVPSKFHFEQELPQLPSGKIDRRTLAARPVAPAARRAVVEASNEVEARLLDITREIFGHADIGTRDDFFEAGGDSFKAIRIAAKYGPPLEVGHLYQHPTIAALAAHLSTLGGAGRRLIVPLGGDPAQADAVVLCFPNAAGEPVNFIETARALGAVNPRLSLCAVQLPRRAAAGSGEMLAEMTRLAAAVCDALPALTSAPLLALSQCNGAALSIAVARELRRRGGDLRALCIGAALMQLEPCVPDRRTDDELIASLGGMGAALPAPGEEQAFFLREFRYDCEFADAYCDRLVEELDDHLAIGVGVPAWCLAGTVDPLMAGYERRYADWGCVADAVHLREVPGVGHFLLRDCPQVVASVIEEAWQATRHQGKGK